MTRFITTLIAFMLISTSVLTQVQAQVQIQETALEQTQTRLLEHETAQAQTQTQEQPHHEHAWALSQELAQIKTKAQNYTSLYGDKYNAVGCGVASFFIPGLGQAICGEWGRAAGFFFGGAALYAGGGYLTMWTLWAATPQWSSWGGGRAKEEYICSAIGAALCFVAALGLDIYSAIDASRIANVKNLYYRDKNSGSLSLEPSFSSLQLGAKEKQSTAGLALKFRF